MANKINTKDITLDVLNTWLLEQTEEVQKQAAELTANAKTEGLKRKLEPLKTKMAKAWDDIQKLADDIEDIDENYSGPWVKNPQEIYLAICAELDKAHKTLDELHAALPQFTKEKIKQRLDKGLTGKKTVFVLTGEKYSRKTK